MDHAAAINYQRIAQAITYIQQHFREQPDLDDVARQIHLSPFHFQRLFSEWAGISPKKFLQYISVEHAKQILRQSGATLADAAYQTGLSGTGRLHDLFVNIEAMTPGEFKNQGKSLTIRYSYAVSPFGKLIIASTAKGICYMAFCDEAGNDLEIVRAHFPNAFLEHGSTEYHQQALAPFGQTKTDLPRIKLHLKGTAFQLKVWDALLKIPKGNLTTYGAIAHALESPGASRAVGTAIGSNPVAFLIPCHRVIQSTGNFGGYMWGPVRKTAIIGWEAAQINASLVGGGH